VAVGTNDQTTTGFAGGARALVAIRAQKRTQNLPTSASKEEMDEKLRDYFAAGARLV